MLVPPTPIAFSGCSPGARVAESWRVRTEEEALAWRSLSDKAKELEKRARARVMPDLTEAASSAGEPDGSSAGAELEIGSEVSFLLLPIEVGIRIGEGESLSLCNR